MTLAILNRLRRPRQIQAPQPQAHQVAADVSFVSIGRTVTNGKKRPESINIAWTKQDQTLRFKSVPTVLQSGSLCSCLAAEIKSRSGERINALNLRAAVQFLYGRATVATQDRGGKQNWEASQGDVSIFVLLLIATAAFRSTTIPSLVKGFMLSRVLKPTVTQLGIGICIVCST